MQILIYMFIFSDSNLVKIYEKHDLTMKLQRLGACNAIAREFKWGIISIITT